MMAIIRCLNGHYFDDKKHQECPRCLMADWPITVSARQLVQKAEVNLASSANGNQKQNAPALDPGNLQASEDQKTEGVFPLNKGSVPVVGWLVCVDGKERGRDFRLHVGRNSIGSSLNSDLALLDDEGVSRENHCSLVFEPRTSTFSLVQGSGDGVLVKGEKLRGSVFLCGDDTIIIGASTFVFVPFCREGRSW